MREITIRYSYTYGFLQTILSAYLYLLEEYISPNDKSVNETIVLLSKRWNSESENLSSWIFEIQTSIHEYAPVITRDEAFYIFSSMEELGDEFTFLWCDKLDLAAKSIYEKKHEISQGLYLYYLYCGVTYKTLMEFDEVITDLTSDFPTLYHRQQEGKEVQKTLTKLLNNELESIEKVTELNEYGAKELREIISSTANDLIQDWHTAITSAVNNYLVK